MTRQEYIKQARAEYQSEGKIEIDDNAKLSRGTDNGAYVEAWVWVEDLEAEQFDGSENDPDAEGD